MSTPALLLRLRTTILKNYLGKLRTESKLKTVVISFFALGFWLLMFGMFWDVFTFLDRFEGIKVILLDYLFSFFFLALLVMMTISNGIIAYASLFRSRETAYLMVLPMRPGYVFAYKSLESLLFSSWGLLTMVVPMIVAYGITTKVSLVFYPASLIFSLVFVLLPTAWGAIGALLLTTYFPRKRRNVLILLGAITLVLCFSLAQVIVRETQHGRISESTVKSVLDRIRFCQHWLLPSRWVSDGIMSASRGDFDVSAFQFLLLIANVLFSCMVACVLGRRMFAGTWARAQSKGGQRRYSPDNWTERVLRGVLFFLPRHMRLLVLKDLKTFRRDPTQWSQCLLFFGLLALYVVNLPRFRYSLGNEYYRNLISFTNLAATCMILSTFTSRFIFPQLSLEGQRFWILGLLPMKKRTIIWGKFFFSAAGSLVISGPLIIASDVIMRLPWWMILVHFFAIVVSCCGLSGLAVGLGALYPNLEAENPSKVVSSFGGTLNLILSIGYVAIIVTLVAMATYALSVQSALARREFTTILSVTIAGEFLCGFLVTGIPMLAGLRAFRRMEF